MEISLLGNNKYKVNSIYSDCDVEVQLDEGRLLCRYTDEMRAVAVYLK